MNKKNLPLVFACLLTLASCSGLSTGPASGEVDLAADRTDYVAGEEIVAHLSNDSDLAISFSWCELGLERQEIEGWAEFPLPPRACALVLNALEPGKKDTHRLLLESPLPLATYRLLLPVRRDDFSRVEEVYSTPFTVGTADLLTRD